MCPKTKWSTSCSAAYRRAYSISGSVSETSSSASATRLGGPAVGVVVPLARLAAPPVPEAHRQVGMQQPRKEPAQRPRAEYRIEEFEHRLSVDVHVVAVGDEDVFTVQAELLRRGMYLDAALAGEVIADPHVVVAREEDHPHAPVGQFGQLAQRPHEALGDHTPVFEPEIEDVPDQKDRLRIPGRVVEPRHEASFDRPCRRGIAGSQVDVGCEIIHDSILSARPVSLRGSCRRCSWPRSSPPCRSGSWPGAAARCKARGPRTNARAGR